MKVILISEENHGIIGCVASKEDVIPFLVDENWINQDKGVWNSFIHNFEPLKYKFGENWLQELLKMELDELAQLFSYQFAFDSYELWRTD